MKRSVVGLTNSAPTTRVACAAKHQVQMISGTWITDRQVHVPHALRGEVVITINGKKHWLWRAVDQDGTVLDEIVQTRRNTKAAIRLLKRLLKQQGIVPKRMITDKLGSYGAARRQIMPNVEHRSHKGLNNRAENSHVPLRKRERMMQGFRSSGGLQRFISVFSSLRNLFVPPRSKCNALQTLIHRLNAMAEWNVVTGVPA